MKIPCPICSKPSSADHKPFCSKHCADVDLGRWLNESYVIPGSDMEEPDFADPDVSDYRITEH